MHAAALHRRKDPGRGSEWRSSMPLITAFRIGVI